MIYDESDIIEYANMIRDIRQGLGMERREFAKFLNVHPRTVQLWESFTSPLKTTKGPTYQRIIELKEQVSKNKDNPNRYKLLGQPGRPRKN